MFLLLRWGWIRLKDFKAPPTVPEFFVSVIIAVRNEQNNIPKLLNDLVNQGYPKDKYEIIIVNDHSTDDTLEIVENYASQYGFINCFSLKSKSIGKKAALHYGIGMARGRLIITTDGDVKLEDGWIKTMVAYYSRTKAKMILAPVIPKSKKGFFHNAQSIELLALTGATGGSAYFGFPLMANGANMAFEKDCYQDYLPDYKWASGDDMFFMQFIKKKYINKIKYLRSLDAVAWIDTEHSLISLLNQRKRWVSKSKGYTDIQVIVVALVVLVFNINLAFSLLLSFLYLKWWLVFGCLFVYKSIIDFYFLKPIAKYFHKQENLSRYLFAQIVYIIYVPVTAISGLWFKFSWKNRKY